MWTYAAPGAAERVLVGKAVGDAQEGRSLRQGPTRAGAAGGPRRAGPFSRAQDHLWLSVAAPCCILTTDLRRRSDPVKCMEMQVREVESLSQGRTAVKHTCCLCVCLGAGVVGGGVCFRGFYGWNCVLHTQIHL